MSNEQLKIKLLNIIERLQNAVDHAEEALIVDNVNRHQDDKYAGKALIPSFIDKLGDDWVKVDGEAIALDNIRNVILSLENQADMLGGTLLDTKT